ncbi:MAG: VWA domain-containing protein [Acidobacteria bacterium]|nr:VWA domain-containing protein [Acidobacteriota bacterium]
MNEAPSPLVRNLLVFPRMLRRAGLPVSPEQSMDFLRALEWVDLGDREQVFHAARCLLVTRAEHLKIFSALFGRFWALHRMEAAARGQKAPQAPRHDRPERPFDVATYMAFKARTFDPEVEVTDRSSTFSSTETLRRKDFSALTPEELETLKRLMESLRWRFSQRQTRRREAHRRDSAIHLRRALSRLVRHGGLALELPRWRRRVKPRPLVLLADISGSMEKYSRLLLQFFYSVSQSLPATECFVFGTRLSRITPHLKLKNVDRALDEAAREVVDWAGGTRIGECLAEFNRRWGKRVLRRGAVVIVVSDGWERGDAVVLAREMAHLQRRCHRLIWLNPLAGKDRYQPLVEGMAAAIPYVDDFLPVHNLQSLETLAEHLASLPGGGSRTRRYS